MRSPTGGLTKRLDGRADRTAVDAALIAWLFRKQLPAGDLPDRAPPRPPFDRRLTVKALLALALFIGLIAVFIGIADLKDRAEAKKEEAEDKKKEEEAKKA